MHVSTFKTCPWNNVFTIFLPQKNKQFIDVDGGVRMQTGTDYKDSHTYGRICGPKAIQIKLVNIKPRWRPLNR